MTQKETEENLIELAELFTMMAQRLRELEATVHQLKAEVRAAREVRH